MDAHKFTEETAARALLEAMYSTDREVAERYSCTPSALQKWRMKLRGESWFVQLVEQEREAMRQRWLGGLDDTLGEATATIKTIATEIRSNPDALAEAVKSPAILDALTRSVATLAQVRLAHDVIAARIALLREEAAPPDAAREQKQIGPGVVIVPRPQ